MKRLDFNQDWNFWKEGGEKQEKVNLPHDAMLSEKRDKDNATQSGGAYFAGGTYHYTKKLYIQEGWENVFLECEGVYQNSTVKVNGTEVYFRPYGYSNFYVNLMPHLKKDVENEIEIIADNSKIPNSRWYSGSGIYREVGLHVGGASYVKPDGIRITPLNSEKVLVETEIVGEGTVTVEIWDGKTKVAQETGEKAVIVIPETQCWSESVPKLYTCSKKGLCWVLRKNPKYQPLFFSEALFLQAVKHTVAALRQDFLDLMSGKTELDEASLIDLLTVQMMGCLGMCRKHLGESDEEWCRFHSCFDLFLKAGYQGIIQK